MKKRKFSRCFLILFYHKIKIDKSFFKWNIAVFVLNDLSVPNIIIIFVVNSSLSLL